MNAHRGTDREAIGQAGEDYVAAVLSGDAVAFAACYTEDAVVMVPGEEAIAGRGAIQAWYQGFVNKVGEMAAFEPSIDEIVLLGEWAFRRGNARIVMRSHEGVETGDVVKFIEIWQRQPDGSWKIARDIWNSNLPEAEGEE